MAHQDDCLPCAERRWHALRMLRVLEIAKSAIKDFDSGDINLDEAVRRISAAVAFRKAA
jgi:hypothetical protein